MGLPYNKNLRLHACIVITIASTSAKWPPLWVVDHYGSRKGVHPFTDTLTTFNVTGCIVYLFGEGMVMNIVTIMGQGQNSNNIQYSHSIQ